MRRDPPCTVRTTSRAPQGRRALTFDGDLGALGGVPGDVEVDAGGPAGDVVALHGKREADLRHLRACTGEMG